MLYLLTIYQIGERMRKETHKPWSWTSTERTCAAVFHLNETILMLVEIRGSERNCREQSPQMCLTRARCIAPLRQVLVGVEHGERLLPPVEWLRMGVDSVCLNSSRQAVINWLGREPGDGLVRAVLQQLPASLHILAIFHTAVINTAGPV